MDIQRNSHTVKIFPDLVESDINKLKNESLKN